MFKVICVVNIKFFFMDLFYYNLIILIKQCKIPLKKLDKVLLCSRNQVFCLKIWKFRRAPTNLQFSILYWNFPHLFHLLVSPKACSGFFLFCSDFELYSKIKKTWFLQTRFLQFFLIIQDLSKMKKIPNTLL